MSNVIQKHFQNHVGPGCMRACQPLKRTGEENSKIISFVYLNDKIEINERWKQLVGQLNKDTQLYVNERLPKADFEVRKDASNWDWHLLQKIVLLKFSCQKPKGGLFSQEIISIRAVDHIADAVIKKKKKGTVHVDKNSVYNGKSACRKKQCYEYANGRKK